MLRYGLLCAVVLLAARSADGADSVAGGSFYAPAQRIGSRFADAVRSGAGKAHTWMTAEADWEPEPVDPASQTWYTKGVDIGSRAADSAQTNLVKAGAMVADTARSLVSSASSLLIPNPFGVDDQVPLTQLTTDAARVGPAPWYDPATRAMQSGTAAIREWTTAKPEPFESVADVFAVASGTEAPPHLFADVPAAAAGLSPADELRLPDAVPAPTAVVETPVQTQVENILPAAQVDFDEATAFNTPAFAAPEPAPAVMPAPELPAFVPASEPPALEAFIAAAPAVAFAAVPAPVIDPVAAADSTLLERLPSGIRTAISSLVERVRDIPTQHKAYAVAAVGTTAAIVGASALYKRFSKHQGGSAPTTQRNAAVVVESSASSPWSENRMVVVLIIVTLMVICLAVGTLLGRSVGARSAATGDQVAARSGGANTTALAARREIVKQGTVDDIRDVITSEPTAFEREFLSTIDPALLNSIGIDIPIAEIDVPIAAAANIDRSAQ